MSLGIEYVSGFNLFNLDKFYVLAHRLDGSYPSITYHPIVSRNFFCSKFLLYYFNVSVCRHKILKRHLPFPEPVDSNILQNVAARLEEAIFNAAHNQVHFIRLTSNSVVLNDYSESDFTRMTFPSSRCVFNYLLWGHLLLV